MENLCADCQLWEKSVLVILEGVISLTLKKTINNRGGDSNAELMTSVAVDKQRRTSKNQGGKT